MLAPSRRSSSGKRPTSSARFGRDALGDAELVQRYLTRDEKNPVSLGRSVAATRENARSIREVISLEVWQVLNELHVFLGSDEAEAMYERDRDALYGRVQRSTQLCLGLMRSTMLHDAPLDFVWLGVLLERIGQTARLLDVQHHALDRRRRAARGPRDRALALAAARVLRVRGVHEAEPWQGDGAGGRGRSSSSSHAFLAPSATA